MVIVQACVTTRDFNLPALTGWRHFTSDRRFCFSVSAFDHLSKMKPQVSRLKVW
jgi:hypothetical protein